MVSDKVILENMNNTLKSTNFHLKGKYEGKVRDSYNLDAKSKLIITTDRISAFDRVLTTIPFKGQVLNEMSSFWFDATKKTFPNHVIEVPDAQAMVVKKCRIIPLEMVVRGYLTGSAWRDYKEGKTISGFQLPQGMHNWEKFDNPLITPSTKEELGHHDRPVSREELLEEKIVEPELYKQMEEAAVALFKKGTKIAASNGLILVDTKYEFGFTEKNELVVADEMHTSDSSRYWIKKSYAERFDKGIEPEVLDKEFLRQWLIKEKNFMGNGPIPAIPDVVKLEVAKRYIKAFELITGKEIKAPKGLVLERIEKNLMKKGYLKESKKILKEKDEMAKKGEKYLSEEEALRKYR